MTDNLPALQTEVANVHVFARHPAEMEQAQQSLIDWCGHRMAQERAELAEASQNLEIAKRNKWRASGWQRRIKLSERKIEFYEKVEAALRAGYYIIPDFPVDVIAIRTTRKTPSRKQSEYGWDRREQSSSIPALGAGRHVSVYPEIWQRNYPALNREGQKIEKTTYWAEKFQEVDFPLKLVKPEILDETGKAMALKAFDEIGVLPVGRKPDPIVVGRIIPPHRRDRPVTFFIAWWLDTSDL